MSVCSPCLQVCRVPLCTAEIILGTISSISTDVNILIENKSTGAKKIIATQSDNTGKVTLVTSGLSLMADQSYEISVLLKTAPALCDREILTIGTSTASCVTVIFENIKDSRNCQVSFESQTLTPITENTQPGTNCLCVTQAMLDVIQTNTNPYRRYTAFLTQQGQIDGLLEIGVQYKINFYSPGDDFTNVGAAMNATGQVFIATGTTPNSYSNFSYLTNNKPPAVIVIENTIGNITWSYIAESLYKAELTGAFLQNKTWFILSKTSNTNQFIYWGDIDSIYVQTSVAVIGPSNNPGDPISWMGIDGELYFNEIEIRVYP